MTYVDGTILSGKYNVEIANDPRFILSNWKIRYF